MKKAIILILSAIISFNSDCLAQSQTIDGNLNVIHSITANADINIGNWNVVEKTGLGSKLNFGGSNFNTDFIWMAKYSHEDNFHTDLRVSIGDDMQGDDRFVVGNVAWNSNDTWKDWFVVTNQSRVGIGISNPSCALDVDGEIRGNKLDINGTIRSKEVKIEAAGWADFVFNKGYKLPTLQEVEQHINDKGHLPDIPSELEVKENGIDVVEMQAKLLQKIEELTLYTIKLEKKCNELDEELKMLKQQKN